MFNKTTYGRILVPMVTPFNEDQSINYDKAANLAHFLVKSNNADSIVVSGTTGEFHTMVLKERAELLRRIYHEVGEKIPLLAGVGCASTIETIELTKEAEKIGYETVMIVAPYYTKPNQEQLYAHYKKIAESVNVNIMLYNIPIFAGVNIEPETVAKLAEEKNIVAIKEEAELNPKQVTAILNSTPEDFIMYDGDDTMILECFAQGGPDRIGGVISGASHLIGKTIRNMIETFLSGKVAEAAKMQREIFPVLRVMGQNERVNPVCLWKEALKLAGIDAGIPRLPLTPGTPEEIEKVKAELKKMNVI